MTIEDITLATCHAPRMVRVQWVSNETPDREGQGGQRRQFFQIKTLAEAGHEIRVVTLDGPQDDMSIRHISDDVHRVPALEWRGRLPLPWRRRALRQGLSGWADVIVVAHTESWPRFQAALPPGVPVLVDVHNVLSPWHERSGRPAQARAWAAVEREIRQRATLVSVTQRREVGLMPDGRAPILVVESGVDPDEWSVEPIPADRPVIKLFGNWDWAPNAAGIHWFLMHVWPAVHDATGSTCEIAGTDLSPELRNIDGAVTHGRVHDLQRFLSDAWCIAVPVREGVGAPVKYAEALSGGVPVIATEDGAPGHREMATVSDDARVWIDTLTMWLGGSTPPCVLTPAEREARVEDLAWATQTRPLEEWVSRHGQRP